MSPKALDSNRRGELSATQRDGLSRTLQQRNRSALSIAGALIVAAVLVGVFSPPSVSPVWRIAIVGAPLAIAISLILRILTGADRALARDLRRGKVEAVTGPIFKEQESAMDVDGTSVYILRVGDERFTVPEATSEAAPRNGQVRLYYLPASRKVLNLETFADETPAGAPPPLAEAIIGRWRNNFAKATFTVDGRVTASVMGRESAGQWSVDAEGSLHAEIAGRAEIVQASVTRDELSITLSGRVVTLSREA
jgi:hypothetical protein